MSQLKDVNSIDYPLPPEVIYHSLFVHPLSAENVSHVRLSATHSLSIPSQQIILSHVMFLFIGQCDPGWLEYKGQCYAFKLGYRTWHEASDDCRFVPLLHIFVYSHTCMKGSQTYLYI